MTERERFNRLITKYPHPHVSFFERPQWTRRNFFRLLGSGLTGYFLGGPMAPTLPRAGAAVEPKGTAKQVIFLFLQGAPSPPDTFDFKMTPDTPSDFNPETVNGIHFPVGLLPNTAQILDKIAIIRSGLSWALAHNLAQTWFQIGRSPISATGGIAPHSGSVVGLEWEPFRRPDQIFPSFVALNANNIPGSGYFPVSLGPFKTRPSIEGLTSTQHADGQARFEKRWDTLQLIDAPLRGPDSPLGAAGTGMGGFYESARNMMFNPVVSNAFSFTEEESLRYGDTSFGDACAIAKKIVAADQGTRFIQVNHGSWDHHSAIYDRNEVNGQEVGRNLYAQGSQFDKGFAALINDLEADGLLDETLILACGEFGRTIGPVTNDRAGRDHYLQMFYVLAGGGVKGGTVIGQTDPTGAFTIVPGWSRGRDVRPEDMEATIYSAMGINWTTIRTDDPLGRGFEYVPMASEDAYGPVHELWGMSFSSLLSPGIHFGGAPQYLSEGHCPAGKGCWIRRPPNCRTQSESLQLGLSMPIFEYHCNDCTSKFEQLVLSSKDMAETVVCSDCGSESVEKLFSTFAAQTSNGSKVSACANQAAGVCQAGGGSMPCGMG